MSERLITLKLYLYDSSKLNGLGEELKNVMIGSKITSCLDDTQDTAEISINGVSNSEPYKPLTKFVVALSQDGNETQYYHYELRYDLVQKLSMEEELYKHTLYLGNPAISCQKRTCDNFAISYRLKDVRLDKTTYNESYGLYVNPKETYSSVGTTPYYRRVGQLATDNTFGSTCEATEINTNEAIGGRKIMWVNNSVHDQIIYSSIPYQPTSLKSYMLIGDNANESVFEKIKNWCTKAKVSSFQIINYDPDNQYYGTSGTYKQYFQSIATMGWASNNSNLFKFTPKLLVSFNGKTYKQPFDDTQKEITTYDKVPISGTNYFNLIPTITTVEEINVISGGTKTILTYKFIPTTYSKIFQNDCTMPSYIDVTYRGTTKWAFKKAYIGDIVNPNNCIVIGYDVLHYKSSNYGNDSRQFYLTPIYMKCSTEKYTGPEKLSFECKSNRKYRITTKAYFGTNGVDRYCLVPTNDNCTEWKEALYNGNGVQDDKMVYAYHYYRTSGNDLDYTYSKQEFNVDEFELSYEFTTYALSTNPELLILKSQSTIPNCYDLFKKSQIVSRELLQYKYVNNIINDWDTLYETKMPYIVDSATKALLVGQNVIEDRYYNKNLWEMFMQIGKYIHAKPYIRFSGDKYQLCFKKYGISDKSAKTATQNSIFANYNIETYISSLDSYLENYFEYGNVVEEYLRPTDNDGSGIVTNDNAVLKTSHKIMEIVSLKVASIEKQEIVTEIKLPATEVKKTLYSMNFYDITDYIYEHNVYKCLSLLELDPDEGDDGMSYLHFRGNSIYYHNGETSIQGFQYTEPSSNSDRVYAIKRILGGAFGVSYPKTITSFQVNDFIFKIQYRTNDDVRFKTYKPDLRKFMKSSSTDILPMQSQFNNQSDKVVDSSKYGNNVYGTLLRSGNETKDYQEYVTEIDQMKDSGELYELDNQYYVSKNTSIVYPTYIESEVEYSKDFNKLSEIIGIDSTPRFYEIAENGVIKRNVVYDRMFIVGDVDSIKGYSYLTDWNSMYSLIKMTNNEQYKYAVLQFEGATKTYNQETNGFYSCVCVPCIEYATSNSYTLECDLADNFMAGDMQQDVSSEYNSMYANSSWIIPILEQLSVSYNLNTSASVAKSKAIQYCDVFGKADTMSCMFVEDIIGWYNGEYGKLVTQLPKGDINAIKDLRAQNLSDGSYVNTKPIGLISQSVNGKVINDYFYVLDKDSREQISFNFSCHLITASDRFVMSNDVFRMKRDTDNSLIRNYKIFYLDYEINKFERDTINGNILYEVDCPTYSLYSSNIFYCDPIKTTLGNYYLTIQIRMYNSDNEYSAIATVTGNGEKLKCVALGYYYGNTPKFILARNVTGLDFGTYSDSGKVGAWHFRQYKR